MLNVFSIKCVGLKANHNSLYDRCINLREKLKFLKYFICFKILQKKNHSYSIIIENKKLKENQKYIYNIFMATIKSTKSEIKMHCFP